jgi:catalase (peroxidase I)
MRFSEANHGANAGLGVARDFLEPVKKQFPAMSYADLWILASYAAIEFMGGPDIPFTAGRKDATDDSACPPEHMLPDGHFHKGSGDDDYDHPGPGTAAYVRWVFGKMGFNDREMVCLIGAHALGRCHTNASGYDGPWTRAPETFSNEYFKLMLEDTWTVRSWGGPVQYENSKSGADLMMLPADIVLVEDPAFKAICEEYAADYDLFAKEFAVNFKKLTELGFTEWGLKWCARTPTRHAVACISLPDFVSLAAAVIAVCSALSPLSKACRLTLMILVCLRRYETTAAKAGIVAAVGAVGYAATKK